MREYIPQYLERETYRRTLSVARSYLADKNKIKQIEHDLLFRSCSNGENVKGKTITDPTYNTAAQIIKHTEKLKEHTEAVEKTLNKFNEKEKKVILQNVFQGIPMIYCNVKLSERSMKRVRKRFLMALAIELGEAI